MTEQTPITEIDVREHVRQYAEALTEYTDLDERYKNLLAVFEEEHKELIESRTDARKVMNQCDTGLREIGFQLYTTDPQAWSALNDEAVTVAFHNVAQYDEATLWSALVARAPIYLKVNDVALQDLAKAEVSARPKYIASMLMVLPELTFARVPFIQISDPKLLKRVRGSV